MSLKPATTRSAATLTARLDALHRATPALERDLRASEALLTLVLRHMRIAAERAARRKAPGFVPLGDDTSPS